MKVMSPLTTTLTLLLAATGLALWPGAALEAAEARIVTAAPTEHVIAENQGEGASGIQLRNQGDRDGSNRWVGFSFTAGAAGSLDKISLFLSTVGAGAPESTIHVALVALTGPKDLPGRPYTEIAGEDATLPADIAAPDTLLTLDLAKAWPLEAGASYGIILSFIEAAQGRRLNFTTSKGKDVPSQTFHTADAGATYETVNPVKFVLQAP